MTVDDQKWPKAWYINKVSIANLSISRRKINKIKGLNFHESSLFSKFYSCYEPSIVRRQWNRNSWIIQIFKILACVAGGIREVASERQSRHIPSRSPRGNSRAARPGVNFPPATFRMVFACRPLLSLLMIQLDKPIRERSLNQTMAKRTRKQSTDLHWA